MRIFVFVDNDVTHSTEPLWLLTPPLAKPKKKVSTVQFCYPVGFLIIPDVVIEVYSRPITISASFCWSISGSWWLAGYMAPFPFHNSAICLSVSKSTIVICWRHGKHSISLNFNADRFVNSWKGSRNPAI